MLLPLIEKFKSHIDRNTIKKLYDHNDAMPQWENRLNIQYWYEELESRVDESISYTLRIQEQNNLHNFFCDGIFFPKHHTYITINYIGNVNSTYI